MTHGIRPPAAKEHTLIQGRKLADGEWSKRIPRDLVTRHGPYKVLNPSEALLLAGICSLRPGKYVSKSRLFKAAGMDINQGRNVLARLVEKGFILEVGHSWMPVIPEGDEQPTAEQQEQPTAKKEEKEEASPEQPQQPLTVRKVDRPKKVNKGEVQAANAPNPEELAEAWNKAASWSGDPEYGHPIVQQNVKPEDFTPAVIRTLMFHASTNDVDPTDIMRSVVCYSSWYRGLDGKNPAYVIGTVTDNEAINQRFYDSFTASQRRKEKREEEERKQWEADAPLRAAEEAREKAEREEYERRQKELSDIMLNAYIKSCRERGIKPDGEGFTSVMSARYPKTPRLASLSSAIISRNVHRASPVRDRVFVGDETIIGSEARHEMLLDVAEKLTYTLCMMGGEKSVPTLEDLNRPFVDELDKVLEARINCSAGALAPCK